MRARPETIEPASPTRPASQMLLFLESREGEPPSATEIVGRTGDTALPGADWAMLPLAREAAEKWRARVDVAWQEGAEPYQYEVWLRRNSDEGWHFEGRGLSEEEKKRVTRSDWVLGVATGFGEEALLDYHRLLRVVAALAPDAPAFMDVCSCVMRSGTWLRQVIACDVPPHPRNLFSIHTVYDPKDPEGPRWLHTHGMLRCGSVEFEILGASADKIDLVVELLETICVAAAERGPGPPGVAFSPGSGFELEWLPWPMALRYFRDQLGARQEDRDDYHSLPSGVLVERRGRWPFRRYGFPRGALETMEDNPILYVTGSETRRMEKMAAARFDMFRRVFERRQDQEGWSFYIKLGYPIDDAEDDGDREHLWFECAEVGDGRTLAELISEPRHVSNLARGQRDWHDLARMTDWHVRTPDAYYDPDSIAAVPDALDG